MGNKISMLAAALGCMAMLAMTDPASAGTITFAVNPCQGCGLDGFTGVIRGVGPNGTFTPTSLVITGYTASAFAGGPTPTPPIDTTGWTSLTDLEFLSGMAADTVTLSNGILQGINIDLMNPAAPNAEVILYKDASFELVGLQFDAMGPSQSLGSGVSAGSPGLVNYTYSDGVAVPEPASLLLLGIGVAGSMIGFRRGKEGT